jgi:hypothetical protein
MSKEKCRGRSLVLHVSLVFRKIYISRRTIGFWCNMKTQSNKAPTTEQEFQNAIIIDATPAFPSSETLRICWNTGEQKNCPGCYLSKGCKARE